MTGLKRIIFLVPLIIGVTTVSVFSASAYGTPADLAARLTGRTVESVVQEKAEYGKAYGTIADEVGKLDEFKDEILQMKRDILAKKVADGIITQEEADEIIAAMEQNCSDCDGTGKACNSFKFGIGFGQQNGSGQGRCQGFGIMDGQGRKNGQLRNNEEGI